MKNFLFFLYLISSLPLKAESFDELVEDEISEEGWELSELTDQRAALGLTLLPWQIIHADLSYRRHENWFYGLQIGYGPPQKVKFSISDNQFSQSYKSLEILPNVRWFPIREFPFYIRFGMGYVYLSGNINRLLETTQSIQSQRKSAMSFQSHHLELFSEIGITVFLTKSFYVEYLPFSMAKLVTLKSTSSSIEGLSASQLNKQNEQLEIVGLVGFRIGMGF